MSWKSCGLVTVIKTNMVSYEEHVGREEVSVPHPDPVVLELNRLQNLLAGSFSHIPFPFLMLECAFFLMQDQIFAVGSVVLSDPIIV